MKVSFHALMLGLLLSQALSACARTAPETPPATPASPGPATPGSALPNVKMPDTEVRQIKSAKTGRSYDIYIRPPSDYAKNPNKKYPVLYTLDGQWDFKLLDSIYGGLYYDGFIPEMFIVSITYSGESPDYESLRAMDYTPVRDTFVNGSGDAPKFLAFLKEELLPLIESQLPGGYLSKSIDGTFLWRTVYTLCHAQ